MHAEIDLEPRLRAELHVTLDRAVGPHPDWATSPAAARVAVDASAGRRPWGSMRLLVVAAILVVGGAAAAILAARDPDPEETAAPGCPTLADYTAASAQPEPPFGTAPGVSFPPVAPDASPTVGIREPGTWVVVADDEGPVYQMRVRDVRRCERLPDVRPTRDGGHLILANVDVQQLRPGGLGPWVGIGDRLDYAFGEPPSGQFLTDRLFGVPGMVHQSSLRPPDRFEQSTLVVLDVPDSTAVTVHVLADVDGASARVEPVVGWRLWPGDAAYSFGPLPISVDRPGATPSAGQVPIGGTATVVGADGTIAAVTVSDVDSLAAYPAYRPADGMVILEAPVNINAWSAGRDPATEFPDVALPGMRWIATDASGTILRNLGDDPRLGSEGGTVFPLLPSDATGYGFLALEAPAAGSVRLALEVDGREVAWWPLRD